MTTARSSKLKKSSKKLKVEKMDESDEKSPEAAERSESDSDASKMNDEDSDDEKSIHSNSESGESKFQGNPGWADAMAKILRTNKPKKKKTLVLSRAKKLADVKPKPEKVPFEIEGEDGEIKEEAIGSEVKPETPTTQPAQPKKRKLQHSIRIKPSPLDRPREKVLQRIATKGVVQLFNAVKQQQCEIERKLDEAGPLERKREKVLKSIDKKAFLDVLMGGTKSITVDQPDLATKEEEDDTKKTSKVWSVLRDDFVMGANLKDWDKNAPEDEDSSAPEEIDSD